MARSTAARLALLVAAALALAVPACSDDADRADDAATTTVAPGPDRTEEPVPEVAPIDGPGSPFIGSATAGEVPEGYVEEEFTVEGEATSYAAEGELDGSGEWTFAPDEEAPYRTRALVRRPADPDDASGVVIVEWLNVSGGLDADPDWASLQEEIVRQGHTWIGVSAQQIGVEGGAVLVEAPGASGIAGLGLNGIDPDRYDLEHPGDGFSFDIYTQVARAARAGGDLTGGVEPTAVIAAGESQSALALTTYYDGVQPLTEMFDGFFVHSRAFVALPLVAPGEYADLTSAMGSPEPVLLRGDLEAPVLQLQAEGDVIGVLDSHAVRQDDSDVLRLWEVAGTAHADTHLLGPLADQLDCGAPINDGPMHVVAKAGLRSLVDWVLEGTPPPMAPRLGIVEGDEPAIERDGDGIGVGGIRTPPVDVPTQVLSGDPGPNDSLICILMGSTTELADPPVASRYDDPDAYLAAYEAAADGAIREGFVLEEDREALLAYARPDAVG